MAYGTRYVRMAAGDPGFFSGIVKAVSKVAAPVAKVVGSVSKIPVLGKVAGMIPGVGTVLGAASLVGTIAGPAGKALNAARAMVGGSKITKGALSLGGGLKFGGSAIRPGIGAVAAGTALGTAIGAGGMYAGQSLAKRASRPRTQSRPAASRRRRVGTSRSTRCGCKAGTRKVCFKTRRRTGGARTAAQKRFAAASRRHGGRIPKGAKL